MTKIDRFELGNNKEQFHLSDYLAFLSEIFDFICGTMGYKFNIVLPRFSFLYQILFLKHQFMNEIFHLILQWFCFSQQLILIVIVFPYVTISVP